MSETKEEPKKGGWLKTIVGTAAGLLSGAVVMWFSPLLDKVIKPAKPIANFAVEHNGLTVTFLNRSQNGGQGRWDFGDGAPLEFVKADEPSVTHAYRKPGTYQAKFTVTNLLGDENERSVTIELTEAKKAAKPMLTDLHVRPPGKVGQPVFAPATFHFEAQADDAQLFVWNFGDGFTNVQVADDNQVSHTFDAAGTYTITVMACNGKEKVWQDVTVDVYEPPTGALSVSMKVADQGVQVETKQRDAQVSQSLDLRGKNAPATIEQVIAPTPGYEIVSVERKTTNNQNLESTHWQFTQDKKKVKIVGKVVKTSGAAAVLNEWYVVREQRKTPADRGPIPVAGTLSVPGNTSLLLPPVPDNWTDVRRQFAFQVRQDNRVIWEGSQLPQNIPVSVNGRTYTLVATTAGERVQVNLLGRTN